MDEGGWTRDEPSNNELRTLNAKQRQKAEVYPPLAGRRAEVYPPDFGEFPSGLSLRVEDSRVVAGRRTDVCLENQAGSVRFSCYVAPVLASQEAAGAE